MKKLTYRWLTNDLRETMVPEHWLPCPDDALAEILAFRAGARPGDVFDLVKGPDGIYEVTATGGAV